MEDQLTTNEWNTHPDYDSIGDGRIRVIRNGFKITWFRKDGDARAPIHNLQNTGTCAFAVVAMKGNWANNTIKILKQTTLTPQQRLSTFLPHPQTMYLTIIHEDDECSGLAILECDEIPRY